MSNDSERVAQLESLLSEVEKMYGKEWDLTEASGGGLWLSPENAVKWGDLHSRIRVPLGRPLYGDLPEHLEEE